MNKKWYPRDSYCTMLQRNQYTTRIQVLKIQYRTTEKFTYIAQGNNDSFLHVIGGREVMDACSSRSGHDQALSIGRERLLVVTIDVTECWASDAEFKNRVMQGETRVKCHVCF